MAARRGKSQARRNGGNTGGLPAWAWVVLGIVIALAAVFFAPKFLKGDGDDGFIRPRPNPDAQPAPVRDGDAADELPAPATNAGGKGAGQAKDDDGRKYDFYTLLPGQEVQMSDAELAASASAEAARRRQQAAAQAKDDDAADLASAPPAPAPAPAPATEATPASLPAAAAPVAAAQDAQARYLLQAGAFGASGDAESLKARIALLGLNARVESADISGKTVYRVRMGPYGTATELAEAKRKLADGGLPAMAVKVK